MVIKISINKKRKKKNVVKTRVFIDLMTLFRFFSFDIGCLKLKHLFLENYLIKIWLQVLFLI